jgi:hypothetical protein
MLISIMLTECNRLRLFESIPVVLVQARGVHIVLAPGHSESSEIPHGGSQTISLGLARAGSRPTTFTSMHSPQISRWSPRRNKSPGFEIGKRPVRAVFQN